ncbi:MAG: rane fusion protein multidrug efflux system, partial [Acetobacteraceae bacterium]|nr:rane fusion protein multidrug efflux system [Acetobacteraceae bacterium]
MSSTVLARDTVSQPPRTTNIRGNLRRLALAGGAIAILAGGSWYGHDWWTNGRFIQTTDDAYVGGNVTTIAPHIPGFVQDVLIEDNQRVQAGQLLVRLDPRDYQAALDHAQAVVAARM